MREEHVIIDGKEVPIEDEKNVLELARKAGIDIPTFCYHSDLSVYGACRLCLVDIEGMGIVASCSVAPRNGMVIRTATEQIREIRKITVELLLANHDMQCPTCNKSDYCDLQNLARRLFIRDVRFKKTEIVHPVDTSSPSIERNPNRCILCGDCVRTCDEIQGIGALDFAHRGSKVQVVPAFGKDLCKVECVYCGQCVKSCPVGALTIKSDIDNVCKVLDDPGKKVVIQFAPAVRAGIGEEFGMEAGQLATGQLVAALKLLGFDRVFDTSFAADFTVIEEANEFIRRVEKEKNLPQFTSCCPAWVKYAEQYAPDLIPNLSSCKSPQAMLGALAKKMLTEELGVDRENMVVVSVMPCTAKKFEITRPELSANGVPDVDYVITTQELAKMIAERGIRFRDLAPESLDMPMGFKTGAGVIFGTTGGVTEAVLRYAADQLSPSKVRTLEYRDVRGDDDIKETTVTFGDHSINIAVVQGLASAREVIRKIRSGESRYHLIEVMACPGGCVCGAGQPVSKDPQVRRKRQGGLYQSDKMLPLHKSQENPYLQDYYKKEIGEIGGETAHCLLHTHYKSRKRIYNEDLGLTDTTEKAKVHVRVCLGTSCFLRGAQDLLHSLIKKLEAMDMEADVEVKASFCMEQCDRGPSVIVNGKLIEKCTLEKAIEAIKEAEKQEIAL